MGSFESGSIFQPEFFQRDTIEVARDLIGKRFVKMEGRVQISAIITEVEAYLGIEDPACHTWKSKRTDRVKPMWEAGGLFYVYLIYGMHHCVNLVTSQKGAAEAVLIRAACPEVGLERMRQRRGQNKKKHELLRGPGCFARAFAIDRSHSGLPVGQGVWVEQSNVRFQIESGPRVGVDYAGDAAFWPLRFYAKDNPCVSKVRNS